MIRTAVNGFGVVVILHKSYNGCQGLREKLSEIMYAVMCTATLKINGYRRKYVGGIKMERKESCREEGEAADESGAAPQGAGREKETVGGREK